MISKGLSRCVLRDLGIERLSEMCSWLSSFRLNRGAGCCQKNFPWRCPQASLVGEDVESSFNLPAASISLMYPVAGQLNLFRILPKTPQRWLVSQRRQEGWHMGLKRYGCYSTWSFNSFNFFTFLTLGVEKLCLLAYLISSLFQPGSWADHWEGFGRVWRSSSYTCPAHGWWCQWCHQKSSGGTCKGLFNLTETERT